MKYEKEMEFLGKLEKSGVLIIVEGLKDKKVLIELGVRNVFDISGKNFDSVLEKLKENNVTNVVILTDFDKEGINKQRLLTKLLNFNGIKTDETMRKRFKRIFLINKVEELSYFIKKFSLQYSLL